MSCLCETWITDTLHSYSKFKFKPKITFSYICHQLPFKGNTILKLHSYVLFDMQNWMSTLERNICLHSEIEQ